MKQLYILPFVLFAFKGIASNEGTGLLAAPTYTTITKTNGGLFGYKTVNETTGSGNKELDCANPGFHRCRFKAALTGPLTSEDMDHIDSKVTESILGGRYTGTITYNNSFLAVYSYDEVTANVNYTIYTRDEARERGYDF